MNIDKSLIEEIIQSLSHSKLTLKDLTKEEVNKIGVMLITRLLLNDLLAEFRDNKLSRTLDNIKTLDKVERQYNQMLKEVKQNFKDKYLN
jgi:hypothetical protein